MTPNPMGSEPPDPRFTADEVVLVLGASLLLDVACEERIGSITPEEELAYRSASGRLFELIHPETYRRIMSEASVTVTAAVLAADGWAAGRDRFEALTSEQQTEILARMARRGTDEEEESL